MLKRVTNSILDFIFPTTCLFCRSGNLAICDNCFIKIPKSINYENNTLSIYSFKNKEVDKLLWQLKYHHTGYIAEVLGKVLAKELIEIIVKNYFHKSTQSEITNLYLIPIPLTSGDKRLHNHAELIAESIKENLIATELGGGFAAAHITLLPNILIKNTKLKQAHTKSRSQRLENIQNSFSINSKSPQPSLNKNGEVQNIYTIIDDVTTSGATINEARKVLSKYLEIPEKEILGLTVAH